MRPTSSSRRSTSIRRPPELRRDGDWRPYLSDAEKPSISATAVQATHNLVKTRSPTTTLQVVGTMAAETRFMLR
jgi:hypothetical protein